MAVGIIATLKVQDGKQADFEAAFAKMQDVVKAEEPGCLLYSLCQDKDDPTTYRVMEQYTDEDARKTHGRSPAFGEAAAPVGGCLAGAPELIEVNIVS
jgi:quinol monooxygenase YgiN